MRPAPPTVVPGEDAETVDPAEALLRERERAMLGGMVVARGLLLAIMLPSAWVPGTSAVDQIATTALLGVYALGVVGSAIVLRRSTSLTVAGLIGAGLDVLLIATLPVIWHLALGSGAATMGMLLKSSLTVLAIMLVVVNALAVRPLYPAIVAIGALVVHGIVFALAASDDATTFTSSYLLAYTTPAVSTDATITRMLVLAICGAVLTFLAARTRGMVIRAVALQRTNDQPGRYFSPGVVQRIQDDPASIHLGAERRELRFVFTDLAGFTGMVESTEPGAPGTDPQRLPRGAGAGGPPARGHRGQGRG